MLYVYSYERKNDEPAHVFEKTYKLSPRLEPTDEPLKIEKPEKKPLRVEKKAPQSEPPKKRKQYFEFEPDLIEENRQLRREVEELRQRLSAISKHLTGF